MESKCLWHILLHDLPTTSHHPYFVVGLCSLISLQQASSRPRTGQSGQPPWGEPPIQVIFVILKQFSSDLLGWKHCLQQYLLKCKTLLSAIFLKNFHQKNYFQGEALDGSKAHSLWVGTLQGWWRGSCHRKRYQKRKQITKTIQWLTI